MSEWNGHERRKDVPDIVGRLIRLEVLQEKDISEANNWRNLLCGKFEKMMDVVSNLPCDKREGRWLSQEVQIKWLWIAVGFIMTVLTGVTIVFIVKAGI